jgi:hypothetical protein
MGLQNIWEHYEIERNSAQFKDSKDFWKNQLIFFCNNV